VTHASRPRSLLRLPACSLQRCTCFRLICPLTPQGDNPQ
jgi:hypothetical protein